MSSFGGGHVQADGRHSLLLVLPCPSVSWSARCTPFSLVSHVLSGTLTCLVITDQLPLLSRQLSRLLHFAESDFMLSLPQHNGPKFIHCFIRPSLFPLCLRVRWFRFHPGIDVDARLCLKQLPRQRSARAQGHWDLGVLSAHGR